ncbi:unnamed protein product, partial [Hapterophycus canaliculatus]
WCWCCCCCFLVGPWCFLVEVERRESGEKFNRLIGDWRSVEHRTQFWVGFHLMKPSALLFFRSSKVGKDAWLVRQVGRVVVDRSGKFNSPGFQCRLNFLQDVALRRQVRYRLCRLGTVQVTPQI